MIKFTLIFPVIGACLLLNALYTLIRQGKLIIKTEERKTSDFIWAIVLIFLIFALLTDISGYMHYKYIYSISNILNCITWIEICILSIIVNLKRGEIREKGICHNYCFYSWNRIRDYYWLTSSIIQFKVNIFLNINRDFKLTVAEDKDEAEIDEVLQKYIKGSSKL